MDKTRFLSNSYLSLPELNACWRIAVSVQQMVNIVLTSVSGQIANLLQEESLSNGMKQKSLYLPRVMKLRSGGMAPLLAAEAAASLANGLQKNSKYALNLEKIAR